MLRIRNFLRTRFLHVALARQNELLEERVRERTQRMLQMEKRSAMGQLLAGVAHELNNPLAVVMGQDGHHVDTAANGPEALDKIERERYHAVLSDTRMPVLDGIAFYREVERRHPELHGRVAFMTGDTLSAEKREFLDRIGAPSLMKPFSLDEVQRVIQRLMEP